MMPDFSKLEHVKDMYYFDGALISHHRLGEQDYIVWWCDIHTPYSREPLGDLFLIEYEIRTYALIEITSENLRDFLDNKLQCRDVWFLSKRIFLAEEGLIDEAAEVSAREWGYINLREEIPENLLEYISQPGVYLEMDEE